MVDSGLGGVLQRSSLARLGKDSRRGARNSRRLPLAMSRQRRPVAGQGPRVR